MSQQTFVIAGAAKDIGQATARLAAARGYVPALLDIEAGPIEALAAELVAAGVPARAFPCDATDDSAVAAIAAEIGTSMPPVGAVLHAVATRDKGGPITMAGLTDFRRTIEINLNSAAVMAAAFLPLLPEIASPLPALSAITFAPLPAPQWWPASGPPVGLPLARAPPQLS